MSDTRSADQVFFDAIKSHNASFKALVEPQPIAWKRDPETGKEALDLDALGASIDAMKNTGRCYSCNHNVRSEMQPWEPRELLICLDRASCFERRTALHDRQESGRSEAA